MNQRGCPVCEFWARCGPDGTFDAPHHATCPVPAAAVELLLALKALMDIQDCTDDCWCVEVGNPGTCEACRARAAIAKAEGR